MMRKLLSSKASHYAFSQRQASTALSASSFRGRVNNDATTITSMAVVIVAVAATAVSGHGPTSSRAEENNASRKAPSTFGFTSRFHSPSIPLSSSSKALCESSSTPASTGESEEDRFVRILNYQRSQIAVYRKQWEYNANSTATTSTVTPSRSWPDNVPSFNDLSMLVEDAKYCARNSTFRSEKEKEYCNRLNFRIASALLIEFDDASQRHGMEILLSLAEKGYPDAMTFYGMCLNEGRAGNDPDSHRAVVWWKRCADMYQHPQAQYELGVALYTGEGVVEDEEEAVRWFRLASEQDHPAACYMLGDCLLDGAGVEIDRGNALYNLVKSAVLGHRGARSRVMAVLEKKKGEDYGRFTDASRQTLVVHTLCASDEKGHILTRQETKVKAVGGGSRNPVELLRRQTIVGNSRKD